MMENRHRHRAVIYDDGESILAGKVLIEIELCICVCVYMYIYGETKEVLNVDLKEN